jgi:alpha-tubulin suppressor-like RCC1 family protein
MNITNLIIQLQNKLNSGTQVIDNLIAIKAIEKLKTGGVFYVDNFSDLPDIKNNEGKLYFVGKDEILYYNTGSGWSTLLNLTNNLAYSFGQNPFGELGDGTTDNRSSPVSVVGGFTDWCQISSGTWSSIGLTNNGTLWSWGRNNSGLLGQGTIDELCRLSSPVLVTGGFTDWSQVSAGSLHNLGLRKNGTVWAWGSNNSGRLGDGTSIDRSSPVSVVGGFTDWCQVSAGGTHSLGVRQNGTAWAWGYGFRGQLGNDIAGGLSNRSSPVSIVGGFTDWCQVSAGRQHSLAVRRNGTAWAWGCNQDSFNVSPRGVLGDGTSIDRSSPVSVVGGFTDWCQVSAGGYHSLGLRRNGTLWSWGFQGFLGVPAAGFLGDGTSIPKSSPVSVVGGFTDWCQVSVGQFHSLGVRRNGTVWAWGWNGNTRLGDGTTDNRSSPVSIVGGFTDWCQVSAGCNASFAIRKINI